MTFVECEIANTTFFDSTINDNIRESDLKFLLDLKGLVLAPNHSINAELYRCKMEDTNIYQGIDKSFNNITKNSVTFEY